MKRLRIHPVTWVFLLVLILTGFGILIVPYLLAISLHELGHAYVAKKLGYTLNKIWILPYGACISFEEFSFNPNDEIKIALAGPSVNVCLIIFIMMLWWIFPGSYIYTYAFALSNFSIAVFNLLPAFPLDGGRILAGFLRKKYKTKKSYKIISILNLLFSILFLGLFITSFFFTINFSFGLLAIFLFIGIIESNFQGKYTPLLNQTQHLKQISGIKSFCVDISTPFYKIMSELNRHKYNIIYVRLEDGNIKMVTEPQFRKILERFSLQDSFAKITKR